MTSDEKQPILHDEGVIIKMRGSGQLTESGQQHLIIQPIEFDPKHRNLYGYFALAAFVLVTINYIMLKERTCQISFVNGFQNYSLIQSFHMTALIVAVIVFILSYFNFAVVIYEMRLLFYTSAGLIFVCAALLVYDVVAITTAPCVSTASPFANGVLAVFDATPIYTDSYNIFSAQDGIGITVFFFDIAASVLLFLAGRRFYQKS